MTTNLTDCPNCGMKLKSGILSSVKLLDENKVKIINEYNDQKSTAYCTKCGPDLYSNFEAVLIKERKELSSKIFNLSSNIPIISTHTPLNWDYDILGIITGQSTTGTGVFAEFTSSFTDLFGTQSGLYNKKLKDGESLCFTQLRMQVLDMGGNAIIATDIDYSEVGGGKGMLMVCMAGTAIKLKNPTILGEDKANKISEIVALNFRFKTLNSYQNN